MFFCWPKPTGSQRNTGDKPMQVFMPTCQDHKGLLFEGHMKRIYYTLLSINNLTTIEVDGHSILSQAGSKGGSKYTMPELSLHLSALCRAIL